MAEVKYKKTEMRSKYQDPNKPRKKLGKTKLAHAAKNVGKVIECCEEEKYGGGMSNRSYRGSYDNGMSRRYSNDGYYYDDGGMSHRRGRAMNGRFVSRDGSEMAHRLREMMHDAPDESTRQEIQRLAERMENM